MGHHSCCNQQKVKRGLWSPEEDEKLVRYITTYGYGCWSEVPQKAGLQRCGKSCRLRWINYLRPDIRRGRFTLEEEKLIISLHEVVGNRWAHIASHLPGRTDNEIKNYWNSWIKKKITKRSSSSPFPNNNNNNNASQTSSRSTPLFDYSSINFTSTLTPKTNFVGQDNNNNNNNNNNDNNSQMIVASKSSPQLQETLVSSSAPLFMFDLSGPPPLISTISNHHQDGRIPNFEEADMHGLVENEASLGLNQHHDHFQAIFPTSPPKARTTSTNMDSNNGYSNILPPLIDNMENMVCVDGQMEQLKGWVEEEEEDAQQPFAIGSCYFPFWEQI